MDKRAKITIFIGLGVFLLGIIGMIVGAAGLGGIEEEWGNFALEDATNGTITIVDNDGMGDVGLTFWVKGEYVDEDGNGIWDVCDVIEITVTEKPDITETWAKGASEYQGDFYYEAIHDFDKEGTSSCESDVRNQNFEREEQDLVKIGRACFGCTAGDITFESNRSVWVTYDDALGEEIAEEIGMVVLGFLGGSGALCCGIVIMVVGMILIFTLKEDAPVEMMVKSDGTYVMNTIPEHTVGVGINQSVTQAFGSETITEEMTKAEPYQFPSTESTPEIEEKTD